MVVRYSVHSVVDHEAADRNLKSLAGGPLFLHSAQHLHQPPAVVEVIFLLSRSRLSLDYRVRVAHLVAAARSGGAGKWRAKCDQF